MNETHATKYLESLPRTEARGTTERERRLLAQMGEIPKGILFIKILGEAGKSSASSLLASLLSGAGLRTGTVTLTPQAEPRLAIAADGKAPSHEAFAEAVTAAWNAARSLGLFDPSYEEILLAAALRHLLGEGCRAILVSLPTDCHRSATSALPAPRLCLLTSTGEEKARALIPLIDTADDLVSAPQAPSVYRLLTERAALTHCRLTVPTKKDVGEAVVQNGKLCFSYRGTNVSLPTSAHYQKNNALAVIEAYRALVRQGVHLKPKHLEAALATFKSPLGFRLFSLSPAWLIDAADTPLRLAALADSIERLPDVFGDAVTVWTEPHLADAVQATFGERISCVELLEAASLRRALKKMPPPKDSPLVIVGSKPFAAEALRALESYFLYS